MKKYIVFLLTYIVSFNLLATPQEQSTQVAQAYFDAYIARDWQTLEKYAGDDLSFADPTAKSVFGGVAVAGKKETVAYFTKNYGNIVTMSFNPLRQWISGDVAVFDGTLTWQLKIADDKVVSTNEMPFISIIELKDGRVFRHRDYADYQPFLKAYAEVRPAKS